MELELENAEDGGAVETLFDLCFGGSRAMLSSYRLRAGVDAVASLCFVLREGAGGGVVGAIRYWPVNIVAGRVESVASGAWSLAAGWNRALHYCWDPSPYTQPIKAKASAESSSATVWQRHGCKAGRRLF